MVQVEDLRWKKFPVLGGGFVTLVDVMGDDDAIVQAARVSYGKGTKTLSGQLPMAKTTSSSFQFSGLLPAGRTRDGGTLGWLIAAAPLDGGTCSQDSPTKDIIAQRGIKSNSSAS